MSLHPAIQAFAGQPVDTIALTTVSCVVSALEDLSVATDLIDKPEQQHVLQDVLKKCMAILNSRSKNVALRLACLECLYRLSQPPIPSFRTGLLCTTLNTMDPSVEEMLARNGPSAASTSADVLAGAWEMLTVLVFRFSNYNTQVCRLLLQHTCDGDVAAMVQTLRRVVVQHRECCEWPLLQASVQTLYELTVPSTYYTAEGEDGDASGIHTFTVESFQDRISVLLSVLQEQRVLAQLFASLRVSWHESVHNRSPPALAQGLSESVALGTLGTPDVAHTVLKPTQEQQMELLNWLAALKVIGRSVHNMVEFCRDPKSANALRTRLLCDPQCHDFLAAVVVPAAIAAVQMWAVMADTAVGAVAPVAASKVRLNLLTASVGLLKLLRFALYKPAVGCTPALLTSLECLAAQMRRHEPLLRTQYGGMQLMLLTVECLLNINASLVTTPVNIAEAYHCLLRTIAADTTRCALSNSLATPEGTATDAAATAAGGATPTSVSRLTMTVAEWFILCVRGEESTFCEVGGARTGNASVQLLHQTFAEEEAVLQETEDRVAELMALESQLEMLQSFLLLMTLSEMLSGLPDHRMEGLAGATGPTTASPALPATRALGGDAAGAAKKTKSKKKTASSHPAAYMCDLTGKLMREPVVLRNGHRFEHDALQSVIQQVGHVDPITGESVADDIEVDEALQQEIAAYRVTQAAAKKKK